MFGFCECLEEYDITQARLARLFHQQFRAVSMEGIVRPVTASMREPEHLFFPRCMPATAWPILIEQLTAPRPFLSLVLQQEMRLRHTLGCRGAQCRSAWCLALVIVPLLLLLLLAACCQVMGSIF